MTGMRLPGAAGAIVAPEKVRDYLLAADHPDNGGKANFFALFGFSRNRWGALQAAIAVHPADNEVVRVTPAGDGMRHHVRCNLVSPDGRNPCITTIWAVERDQPPWLITTFPGRPPPVAA